jgi:hypothetical protein
MLGVGESSEPAGVQKVVILLLTEEACKAYFGQISICTVALRTGVLQAFLGRSLRESRYL